MPEPGEQSVVKPEVMLLESLLDEIAAGRLRVPRFQRPFVWEPEQMLDLFDSIERGYPIGSVLVWDTTAQVPSLDTVAGIDIPAPPADGPVSYLLDGHQRLSTLFGTLGKRPPPVVPGADSTWRIYRRLGDGVRAGVRFQHWPHGQEPPADLLPLQAVLRTMDFLAYARGLARSPDVEDAEALIDEAEQLAQRIKSYKIAVIRLVGGGLSHAVEAFARLNSGGRLITAQDMVSALTYRPEAVDSLSDRIGHLQRGIAASGFGLLPTELIFQTLVALTDEQDVTLVRWSAFAVDIGQRLDELVGRADIALGRAVQFLRYEAGVPLARLVPYPLQVVLLAVCFDRVPYPSREQTRVLVRWFWATAWSGVLRSAGNADFWAHLSGMRQGDLTVNVIVDYEAGRARAFPAEFEPDKGRVRAYLLWELREFGRRLDLDGSVIDVVELYARSGPAAYRPVLDTDLVTYTANQIMLPTPVGVPVDKALRELPARRLREVVNSHGIPADALAHLHAGDVEAFVRARAAYLSHGEQAFMAELDVEPPTPGTSPTDYEA